MKATDRSEIIDLPHGLVRLGTYEWPRSEAQQTLGHLLEKFKLGLRAPKDKNVVEADRLEKLSDKAFERDVRALLTQKLSSLLDREYLDWAISASPGPLQRLFVHPPMNDDLLSAWAADHDIPVLRVADGLNALARAPCIVVPKLEDFFSRHETRMTPLFDLLSCLTFFDGKVLFGCNSWALRFLDQFEDVRLSVGQVDTIPAFDQEALAAIIETASENPSAFTSLSSGERILKRNDDGDLCDPFFKALADRSLGHPWIATELFFRGITETQGDGDDDADNRIWVDMPRSGSLPESAPDTLKFALHALMIHGTRDVADLNELLPCRAPHGLWSQLEREGFVAVNDQRVSCIIRNYPDIRSELGAAGFNLDKL